MLALAGLSVVALYTLVPEGRLRNRLKWVVAVVVTLVALARLHLGVDSPTAIVIGVLIGVSFAVAAFRYFAPSEVFPVTYRRGRAAHLDVGGQRGEAIRKAVEDQLGLTVSEIQPVGLSGSAGSTPLRLRVEGASAPYLFGKLYSRTHLRSDRWYKLGRELLYGRLEDEKPFNTVRRLVQQEDYALRVIRDAGVPGRQVVRLRRAHARAGVHAGDRVPRGRGRARRRRRSTTRSSTRGSMSSGSCGTPASPTATSSRPT